MSRILLGALLLVAVTCLLPTITQAQSPEPLVFGEQWNHRSELLQEDRTIRVFTPASYQTSAQAYPVIYVLDGEVAFYHTATAVQFLALHGAMPEALVVAVHNTDRFRDMPIPDAYGNGQEDAFLAYLGDELVPFIEEHYRTQPLRVLIGHSQGGLFATYAHTHPATPFQWFVTLDAPLFGRVESLKDDVVARLGAPGYVGRLVTVDRTLGWHEAWERVEKAASSPAMVAQVQVDPATDSHETMTYRGIYESLQRLFADYAPADITTKSLPQLQAQYDTLSAQYGYALAIPRRLLLRNIDDLLFQMRGSEANAMLDYLVATYGAAPNEAALRQRIAAAIKEGPLDETVADILAAPGPSAEVMAPFLGVWKGEIQTQVPMEVTVTFEVVNGVVQGHTMLTRPDGRTDRLDHVMTRVRDDGTFEFGYMNQMRPRGVIVYSGRLENPNAYRGEMEMRGVKLQIPPHIAATMQPTFIELHRQPDP